MKPSCFINEALLQHKIKMGLPPFAKEQIQEDLSKISSFKKTDLEQYLKHPTSATVAYFQIKNGVVTVRSSQGREGLEKTDCRCKPIYDVINFLAKKKYIRDSAFLIELYVHFTTSQKPSVPIFTFAKDISIPSEKDLILIPDYYNLHASFQILPKIKAARNRVPWEKKKALLFFRGGTFDSTGFRHKLVALSAQYPEKIDAQFVNSKMGKFVEPVFHLNYKYLASIDGARCTWDRLVWHLYSNCLVFKTTSNQVQWFYKGIKPYRHYIPIRDESLLLDKMAWFDAHPEEVRTIIERASHFVEDNLTLEDMFHYYLVLIQEYSKRLES